MTTKSCGHRKHTPITSQSQSRFFGRELTEKLQGDGSRSEMSVAEVRRHLEERKGKKLPEKVKKSVKGSGAFTPEEISQGYRKFGN